MKFINALRPERLVLFLSRGVTGADTPVEQVNAEKYYLVSMTRIDFA